MVCRIVKLIKHHMNNTCNNNVIQRRIHSNVTPLSLLFRVHFAGLNVTRPEGEIGKYKSIPHHHRGEVQFLGR